MPQTRPVPKLTDLVYQPVCELIKQESLRTAYNCITKFDLDEDEEDTEEMIEKISDHYDDVNEPSMEESNPSEWKPSTTFDEYWKKRQVFLIRLLFILR